MTKESIPQHLYKILSVENWEKSQTRDTLFLDSSDDLFIHLSKENQLERIITKYWANRSDFVVLKLDREKLKGDIVLESNPGRENKYYHLYKGSIPITSVVDVQFPVPK